MKKADFETVNKKHSRITASIEYHWLCRFWNFQLPVWACRITARACRFGFNRNDLFFLKYFRSRDEHYKNDLRPVFETWNQLMIQELGYHNVFNELHIDMADRLEGVDPEHIARDHLNAYGYQRDQTFEGIKHFIDAYNRRVRHFIEYFNETIKKGITQYTPTLKEYSTEISQHTSLYYPSNIQNYVWRHFWRENILLMIRTRIPNECELIIEPGQVIIAVGDRENIDSLRTYLDSVTPCLVDQLNLLKDERDDVVTHFENFRQIIHLTMQNVKFNSGFKGKCRWERGYWSR